MYGASSTVDEKSSSVDPYSVIDCICPLLTCHICICTIEALPINNKIEREIIGKKNN